MERRERSNKYFFLIFEKLPKLTKLNSFGTKEMLLFFCLFQLSCILDGAQLLQLEYKTMLHQIPLKARSVSCNYNATQKILGYISYMCILLIFLVNNPNSHSGGFFWLGERVEEIIYLSCTSLAWLQEINLNQRLIHIHILFKMTEVNF